MQRKAGQLSLADGLVKGAKNFLGEADALIDWSEIEQQLEGIYGASTGRPSYPLLTLFKAMLNSAMVRTIGSTRGGSDYRQH